MAAPLVDTFKVDDGTVVDGAVSSPVVPVTGVAPTGSTLAITGGPVCGDGHLCYFKPGSPFGLVTIKTSFAQSKPVSGIGSAQAFGAVTTTITRVPQSKAVVGIGSAQAFGIVTRIIGGVISSSSGVPSAQAFGLIATKTKVAVVVAGVGSAQAFGSLRVAFVLHVSGLGSAQSFGAPVFRTGFTKPVAGLGSAQAFGMPLPVWLQAFQVAGIGSAQAFGALTIKGSIKPQAGGVPSAQAFGAIFVVYRQPVPVAGLGSAQAFGTTEAGMRAYLVWLHDAPCTSSPASAILNEFLVGQAVVGGRPFDVPASEFDLDLALSDCLTPDWEICGDGSISGDGSLCGGVGYLMLATECLTGAQTILDQFLVGEKMVGETIFVHAPPPTLVLDLQPAGSL
jgi:hypothetical protein